MPELGPQTDQPSGSAPQSGGGERSLAKKAIAVITQGRSKLLLGGGGIALLLFLIFTLVMPLKLQSIIKNFEAAAGGRAEGYVERRTDVLVYRYLYAKITGNLASDAIYTNSSPVKMFWGNLEKNKFETKLKEKGVTIERVDKHTIRITRIIGPTRIDIDSPEKLEKFLDKDLRGLKARAAIRQLTSETTRSWQIIKRRHLLKYVVNAYRIRHLSITKKEDKTNPNASDKPSETESQIRDRAITSDAVEEGLSCSVGGACDNPDERHNADGTAESKPPAVIDQSDQPDQDVEAKATGDSDGQGIGEAKKGIRESYETIKDTAKLKTEDLLTKFLGPTVTKVIFKAVPVVGWIALGADLDKFFWEGRLRTVMISMRSEQYAGAFVTFASLADQMKAGELTASQVNAVGLMISEVEHSNAFQRFAMNEDTGLKLTDSQMVGSDTGSAVEPTNGKYGPCDVKFIPALLLGKVPPPNASLTSGDYWTWVYRVNASSNGMHQALCSVRPVLSKVNSILGTAMDGLGWLIDKLTFGISTAIINAGAEKAKEGLMWIFNHVFNPVWGGEWGAPLGNAVGAGAQVVYNQFCADALGCHRIPYQESARQQAALDSAYQNEMKQKTLVAKIADIDHLGSLGTRLLAMIPASPQAAINQTGDLVKTAIIQPFFAIYKLGVSFMPTSQAAATFTRNFAGVQTMGYTDAEVSDPKFHVPTEDTAGPAGSDGNLSGADGKKDQYDCETNKDLEKDDLCRLDVAVAQAACFSALGSSGEDPEPCGAPSAAGGETEPSSDAGGTGGDGSSSCGDMKTCAEKVLSSSNIEFASGFKGEADFQAAKSGKKTNASYGPGGCSAVYLNTSMMSVMLKAAEKYKIRVTAVVSGHHCNGGYHPKGRAFDIDSINGSTVSYGHNSAGAELTNYLAKNMPQGAGVGQKQCFNGNVSVPSGINYFDDSCNHIHFDVGSSAP